MNHPLLERYAALLVHYCTEVRPGEKVMVQVDTAALAMARCLCREALRAGAEPHLRLVYPEQTADLIELASDELLASPAELSLHEMRQMAAFIRVNAPENSRSLQGLSGERMARLDKRLDAVQRERIDNTRWVGTIYPTAASAQDAGMTTDAYERFVFGAMFLFDDDPAGRWRELGRRQQVWVERLARASEVHIEGPGTDLRLNVKGRIWENSDGKKNMPSGEIFTGPVEESAQGTIRFTIPSSVKGSLVQDVSLRFVDGKVVEAVAAQGQELLDAQLATDAGARYLGELGIGTNPHITQPTLKTLFDEKILGTVHLALGSSYPQTLGRNQSAIHWDLICDLRAEGGVKLDGEPFLVGGKLVG